MLVASDIWNRSFKAPPAGGDGLAVTDVLPQQHVGRPPSTLMTVVGLGDGDFGPAARESGPPPAAVMAATKSPVATAADIVRLITVLPDSR
jgi:hypothetical protein